ncbi:MAG: YadA C-terminal domain-containing protein [Polaromonas sp.]|nr:YadA C-terminal domain-containing protein [Polaromonas sp.]
MTAVNGTITNLQSININTVNLYGQNATLVNLTSSNVTAGNLTVSSSMAVKPGANVDMGGNRIQNVGAGVVDGDAANMGQLRIVDKSVKQQAAISAALSAMPLVAGAVGETTVSAGVGSSGGQSALAVGLASRITENLTIKGNAGVAGSTKNHRCRYRLLHSNKSECMYGGAIIQFDAHLNTAFR